MASSKVAGVRLEFQIIKVVVGKRKRVILCGHGSVLLSQARSEHWVGKRASVGCGLRRGSGVLECSPFFESWALFIRHCLAQPTWFGPNPFLACPVSYEAHDGVN